MEYYFGSHPSLIESFRHDDDDVVQFENLQKTQVLGLRLGKKQQNILGEEESGVE